MKGVLASFAYASQNRVAALLLPEESHARTQPSPFELGQGSSVWEKRVEHDGEDRF
jgi:hypothetical protein